MYNDTYVEISYGSTEVEINRNSTLVPEGQLTILENNMNCIIMLHFTQQTAWEQVLENVQRAYG